MDEDQDDTTAFPSRHTGSAKVHLAALTSSFLTDLFSNHRAVLGITSVICQIGRICPGPCVVVPNLST